MALVVEDRWQAPQVLGVNIVEQDNNTQHLSNTAQLRRQIVTYSLKRLPATPITCQQAGTPTGNSHSHRLSTQTLVQEEAWLHTV